MFRSIYALMTRRGAASAANSNSQIRGAQGTQAMARNTRPAPAARSIFTGRMAPTAALAGSRAANGSDGASALGTASAVGRSSGPTICHQARDMIPAMSGQQRQFSYKALVALGRGKARPIIGEGAAGVAHRAVMAAKVGKAKTAEPMKLSPIYVVKDCNQPVTAEAMCLAEAGEFAFSSAKKPKQLVMQDKGVDLSKLLSSGPVRGCDKDKYFDPLPPRQRRNIGTQLAHCVKNLHQSDLAHFDIKPANIAINSNGMVSLIDYGAASKPLFNYSEEEAHPAPVFTPGYAAPEVLRNATASKKADIWSLGMVLLKMEMGLGKVPRLVDKYCDFDVTEYYSLIEKIQNNPDITPQCKEVLRACLALDPKKRPTAEDLLKYDYFRPPKVSEMGVMELSVAHAQAFKLLAEAEQAMDLTNSPTSPDNVAQLCEHLIACRNRVEELQNKIDELDGGDSPVLDRRFEPKWTRL